MSFERKEAVTGTLITLERIFHKKYFHLNDEIIPFMDCHWDQIWGDSRSKVGNWPANVSMIFSKYGLIFKSGCNSIGSTGFWGTCLKIQKKRRQAPVTSRKPPVKHSKISPKKEKKSSVYTTKNITVSLNDLSNMAERVSEVQQRGFSVEKNDDPYQKSMYLLSTVMDLKEILFELREPIQNAEKSGELFTVVSNHGRDSITEFGSLITTLKSEIAKETIDVCNFQKTLGLTNQKTS